MSSKDNFGDRMKAYERLETEQRFIPLLPIYARIDGNGFSKFTKGMERPFDPTMHACMVDTTARLVELTGAKIGYTQSDEISLIWEQPSIQSELWFAGKKQKMVSSLAAKASSFFMRELMNYGWEDLTEKCPSFDCRVFQLPNRVEAANAMLWREQDATKNAISMAAHTFYSQKELHGKKGPQMQEMMFQKGQNFNDYPDGFKRGTFVRRESYLLEEEGKAPVLRHRIATLSMPKFSSVMNRVGVIFDGEQPFVAHDDDDTQ